MSMKFQEITGLIGRGLFLEPGAYDEAADSDNPFVDGLFMVVIIGVVVAIAGAIGQAILWAMTPDLGEVKQIVYEGLLQLPLFEMMRENAIAFDMFQQNYDMGWQIAEFLNPSFGGIFAGLIMGPLALIIGWLWFAIIAHAVAKLLGGNGRLSETLGATALATAPALLNVFGIIPTVVVAAVGIWMLLARYIAVRRVHENLSWGRSLIAVLSPMVVSIILFILFGGFAAIVAGLIIGGMAS